MDRTFDLSQNLVNSAFTKKTTENDAYFSVERTKTNSEFRVYLSFSEV